MIIGDFNFHLETTGSNSKTFHSLTDSFDLTQKVNFPTHIHGHTLDQVLTKSNNDYISVVIDVVKSLHGCDRELIFNVVSQLRSMEIPITSIWKPSPYNSYVN